MIAIILYYVKYPRNVMIDFNLDEEKLTLMKAQHAIAQMAGFEKWTIMIKYGIHIPYTPEMVGDVEVITTKKSLFDSVVEEIRNVVNN